MNNPESLARVHTHTHTHTHGNLIEIKGVDKIYSKNIINKSLLIELVKV